MLYRIRTRLQYRWFEHKTAALNSPPLACEPTAGCQVQTMLTRRDMAMYIVAIKSLLRHYRNIAVTIHSDGTLTDDDRRLLERHVLGATVIMAREADARAIRDLGSESYLFRWRAIDASWRRIVDTELWSTAPKRIIMDADVLVLGRPTELIDWIERQDRPFLLGQPPRSTPQSATGLPAGKHIQHVFLSKLPALASRLGWPAVFHDGTTGGFYGCSRELPLARVEQLLREATSLDIPMHEWGGEQCTVIYLLSTAGGCRLDPQRYFNFSPRYEDQLARAHVVHFFGTYRFHKNLYPSLAARVMSELRAPSAPQPA